jgi:hypothetical protein
MFAFSAPIHTLVQDGYQHPCIRGSTFPIQKDIANNSAAKSGNESVLISRVPSGI